MSTRRLPFVSACAATLFIPALLSAQQDTTRMRDSSMTRGRSTTTSRQATSQTRLRVQKRSGEAAGTLDMRADSIANAERMRADSVNAAAEAERTRLAAIERARTDSIANVERLRLEAIESARRDSVARADSIAREQELRRQYMSRYRLGGSGWYVGLAGGASAPSGTFKNIGYNSGYTVNVPVGWHKENSFLGVRADFNYNQFSGRTFSGTTNGVPSATGNTVRLSNTNPQVLSATLNLTANLFSPVRNVTLYGVGGAGLYNFRSLNNNSALSGYLGNDVLSTNENRTNRSSLTKVGAQAGLGLDWAVGTSAVYIESRFVNVFADQNDSVQLRDFFGDTRSSTLRWVPIVVGIKIR